MISESFYDILCITYDFKTFKGRFPGITKSKPVSMPPDAAGSFGAKISMHDQVCKFLGAYRGESVQFSTHIFISIAFPDT